jgi:hypothetical protein
MASATLCFSGFAREESSEVLQLFEQANAASGNRWTLVPEAEASVLVIDMDSMYGHMTWLKAASSGKTTVGLTAGDRSETDHLLRRPLTPFALKSLLEQLASGLRAPAAAPAQTAAPTPTTAPATPAEPAYIRPSADYIAAITTGQMAALPANLVPHQPQISDYLVAGKLAGPAKLALPGAPVLALDPASQTYAGSATLKPLLPYAEAILADSDFVPIDAAEFDRIKASTGGAQPYMRLLWLCGLTVGHGQLLAGFTPARKFLLSKWPQIEREYAKHFRLATVMMKGPAFIREIAELSGVGQNEVVDFINAGLLSGAVVVEGSASVGGDVARASALLARPRAG